jgi:hypothetical protein
MGGNVPPLIQLGEVCNPCRVHWIGGSEVENKAESLEILSNVVEIGVAVVERAVCCKLRLDQGLERAADLRSNDLSAFGVQISTESLEVRTQQ